MTLLTSEPCACCCCPAAAELAQGDAHNPYYGNPYIEGCDFVANSRSPDLDFASIHLYPWNWSIAVDKRVRWVTISVRTQWHQDYDNLKQVRLHCCAHKCLLSS
jgi:hypothetical protein